MHRNPTEQGKGDKNIQGEMQVSALRGPNAEPNLVALRGEAGIEANSHCLESQKGLASRRTRHLPTSWHSKAIWSLKVRGQNIDHHSNSHPR